MTAAKVIVLDLYCRISVDYDGTLRAVGDQEAEGRAWVKAHAHEGYVLGKVHRDHALSGWKRNVVRPSFDQLMERLETGACDGVWFRDLDRFTRKMEEALRLLKVADRGALVIGSDGRYDLTTAAGRSAFRDKANRAETESELISERTTRGMRNKAAIRGKSLATKRGFARPGYLPNPEGWTAGEPRTYVPDDQLAREVKEVRDMAAAILTGTPMSTIAADLNARGVTTVHGGSWDGATIRQMLEAPALAGLNVYRGEVVGDLPGEPVLDRATWDRLQSSFAGRRRGRPATEYLLSAFLTCGKCGAKLYGRPKSGRTYPEDGKVRREYWCQTSRKLPGCGALVIDVRYADRIIEKAVLLRLGDPAHVDRVARVAARVASRRAELLAEVALLQETGEAIGAKAVTRGHRWVEVSMAPIDARLADLRQELETLEDPESPGTAAEDAAEVWRAADMAQRRSMVRQAFPLGVVVVPTTERGAAALTIHRFEFPPEEGVNVRQNVA